MKRIILTTVLLIATAALLFAFDIFADEEKPDRNFYLQKETSLAIYRDKTLEPQLLLDISVDYENETYRAQTTLQFDAASSELTANTSLSVFLGGATKCLQPAG